MKITDIHPSWRPFLSKEIKSLLGVIRSEISDFTPDDANVLRFMRQDLHSKKVIWLGQDPYYTPGTANGRSFQVATLLHWDDTFRQVSLKNIIRAIFKAYKYDLWSRGVTSYDEIIKKRYKDFIRLDPPEWFDSLEEQGVLFLNASLTCETGKPNSHKKIWRPFFEALIEFIEKVNPGIIWFLWGREAAEARVYLNSQTAVYISRHPMMCNELHPDDFLRNPCFVETKHLINWLGE